MKTKTLQKKFIQKTDELPCRRKTLKPQIDIALEVLAVVLVREHQEHCEPLSLAAIAEICGVNKSAIQQIQQSALRKIREKMRKELRLSFGQMAGHTHDTI